VMPVRPFEDSKCTSASGSRPIVFSPGRRGIRRPFHSSQQLGDVRTCFVRVPYESWLRRRTRSRTGCARGRMKRRLLCIVAKPPREFPRIRLEKVGLDHERYRPENVAVRSVLDKAL
jgi:hypothetical protein